MASRLLDPAESHVGFFVFNMHDNLISLIFFKDDVLKNNYFKKFNNHPIKYKDKYPNIQEYLDNRYNDSDSLLETLYRIYYKIEVKPKCKTCGKPLTFYKSTKKKREKFITNKCFQTYCSVFCEMKDKEVMDKHNKSCLEKYGSVNNTKKQQETCSIKYGVNTPFKDKNSREKAKQTSLIKYGTDIPSKSNIIKEKTKNTCLEKYGVPSTLELDICKLKSNSKEAKLKEYFTKKKNNSFNKSKTEEESYDLLKEKYPDTLRQYRSKEYPFNCDFYIPSLKLYIECNYHWTHGFHPYDPNNEENVKKLEYWNTRYKGKYGITWSIRDVKKRNLAKENNPDFLNNFNIDLSNWNGKEREKIKVICKKCGNIFYKLPGVILNSKAYKCDGCNFIHQTGFNKLQLSINELTEWLKKNKPKFYNEFEVVDTYHSYVFYKSYIKVKCKKCGDIFDCKLGSICNDRKSILCKKCKNKDGDINKLLRYINSHNIHTLYTCQFCGKESKSIGGNTFHENNCKLNPNKKIYNKSYICEYCGKIFNNPQQYAGHKVHHKNK